MIPLMLSLFAAAAVADDDLDTVSVHEWGVIQMDYGFYEAVGAEWCYPDEHGNYRYGEMMIVDAPVVWFHGEEFTGMFSVDIMNGVFTQVYPEPDLRQGLPSYAEAGTFAERASWERLTCTVPDDLGDVTTVDRISRMDCGLENFAWATHWWRDVPSLTVTRESDGWSDRFIYYECTTEALYPVDDMALDNIADICAGPGLLFSYSQAECYFQVEEVMVEDVCANPIEYPHKNGEWAQGSVITEELSSWAGSSMKSEEIQALWNTWRPVILDRCDVTEEKILLFPLKDEVVESISRLTLETDQGYHVEYHRLFLGLIAIR